MLYTHTAVITIQTMGNSPKAAPLSVELIANETGIFPHGHRDDQRADEARRSRDMALGLPDGQHVEEDDERNRREARRSDHAAHRRILLNPRHTFPPDKACGVRPTCLIDGIFLQCLAVAGRMAPVDELFSTPNGG